MAIYDPTDDNKLDAPAPDERTVKAIKAARRLYENDDIEIDDDAKLSPGGDENSAEISGTWVQAWVWVNAEELI